MGRNKKVPCPHCDGKGKIDPFAGIDINMKVNNRLAELEASGVDNYAIRILVNSLAKSLGDAPNFYTLEVHPKGCRTPMIVMVQRKAPGTISPGQRLNELELELKLWRWMAASRLTVQLNAVVETNPALPWCVLTVDHDILGRGINAIEALKVAYANCPF